MTVTKDPDATLDYVFDWSDWLEDGESISTAAVDVDSGITENTGDRQTTSSAVKVWLTGGSVGERYTVSCEITTDNSPARIDERSMTIQVKQR